MIVANVGLVGSRHALTRHGLPAARLAAPDSGVPRRVTWTLRRTSLDRGRARSPEAGGTPRRPRLPRPMRAGRDADATAGRVDGRLPPWSRRSPPRAQRAEWIDRDVVMNFRPSWRAARREPRPLRRTR